MFQQEKAVRDCNCFFQSHLQWILKMYNHSTLVEEFLITKSLLKTRCAELHDDYFKLQLQDEICTVAVEPNSAFRKQP